MENMQFCQSCAMPLGEGMYGTNEDGSANKDFCQYCYKEGKYTWEGTMEEMIDMCAPMMAQNNPGMDEEKAKQQMRSFFPQLKRWKSA